MTEAEITALVERIVDEKLAERDRADAIRSRAFVDRLANTVAASLHQVQATVSLDGKRLARIVDSERRRDERRHGSPK